MNSIKRIIAGAMAVSLVASLAACSNKGDDYYEEEEETTTQITVPINTAKLSEEDDAKVNSAMDLLTGELENKTIVWFSFYDTFHASTSGNTKALSLELFEKKYGGEIVYESTTWDKFNKDFATRISGNVPTDFVPGEDLGDFPNGVTRGRYIPYDDYVDFDNELWKGVSNINDQFVLDGKHYVICTGSSANYVVYYNRSTLNDFSMDDPAELLERGEWTWDAFKDMLMQFCDPNEERYGLDNWFNEKPLALTTGKTFVDLKDGKLVHNLMDADIERALNWQKSLWDNQCVLDKNLTGWKVKTEYMGEGKELFYIEGQHALTSAPEIWTKSYGDIGDVMFVPLPKDPEADVYYVPSKPEAFMLCKGAPNPEGVLRFSECVLAANTDPSVQEVAEDKLRNDYGWTEEMIEMRRKVDEMADAHPVYDLVAGCPTDMASALDSNEQGIRGPFYGLEWATQRDTLIPAMDKACEKFNKELASGNY